MTVTGSDRPSDDSSDGSSDGLSDGSSDDILITGTHHWPSLLPVIGPVMPVMPSLGRISDACVGHMWTPHTLRASNSYMIDVCLAIHELHV